MSPVPSEVQVNVVGRWGCPADLVECVYTQTIGKVRAGAGLAAGKGGIEKEDNVFVEYVGR